MAGVYRSRGSPALIYKAPRVNGHEKRQHTPFYTYMCAKPAKRAPPPRTLSSNLERRTHNQTTPKRRLWCRRKRFLKHQSRTCELCEETRHANGACSLDSVGPPTPPTPRDESRVYISTLPPAPDPGLATKV